jgi:hypothetical protein
MVDSVKCLVVVNKLVNKSNILNKKETEENIIQAGADWPYNEVGKIPRGPSSLGAPKAIKSPPAS